MSDDEMLRLINNYNFLSNKPLIIKLYQFLDFSGSHYKRSVPVKCLATGELFNGVLRELITTPLWEGAATS